MLRDAHHFSILRTLAEDGADECSRSSLCNTLKLVPANATLLTFHASVKIALQVRDAAAVMAPRFFEHCPCRVFN
jgi:hypothetical protein